MPVITSGDTNGWHNEAIAKGPGVVIGRATNLGRPKFIRSDYWPLNTTLYVIDFLSNDERFIYYLFKSLDLSGYDSGSVQPMLNRNYIDKVPVSLPPIAEQRAIATVLGALDDKIEEDRHVVSTLSEFLAATWCECFGSVDEDPGWPTVPIGTVARVVGGSTPSTKNAEFWGGTVAWATPKDLSRLSSAPLLDTDRCITERGLGEISSGLLPVGTVLLSSRAPIGYLAIAEVPVAINQGFIALVAGERLSNLYLWQWLRAHMDDVKSRSNGTTFLEVSKGSFRPMLISVPPEELMGSWTASALPQYRLIVAMERESRALVSLRDILLPKLLSGELRVREAEALVQGAV